MEVDKRNEELDEATCKEAKMKKILFLYNTI